MDTVVRFELTRAYRNRFCKPGPSTTGLHREKNWLAWVESNHQPSVLETAALPVAPHAKIPEMVPQGRLELPEFGF